MFRRKSKKTSNNGETTPEEKKIALIGCGPGAMMFLHALHKKKTETETEKKDSKKKISSLLPVVTCFERASSPGGIWRDIPKDDPNREKNENVSLMYDDMWCNTPKELMEFYDYTFDEHFKKATPSFLPRKDILSYLLARNNGAILESDSNIHYNHTVLSITHNDDTQKFTVTVRNDKTNETIVGLYDKCIWAAGMHGSPYRPLELEKDVFQEYTGHIMHSVEAGEKEEFEKHVAGKKLLFLGDSFSAEDLALRAVKLGAEHVYICARSGQGIASDTTAWPKDKVTVIFGLPYKVQKGKTFKCQAVYWSEKKQRYRRDDEEEVIKTKDIDTVILCTGYDANLDMVEDDLAFDDECEWEVSKGWKMDNNALTISLGDVTPSKKLDIGGTCFPDIYRGLLISNPNMMYLMETQDSLCPILELDIHAHLLLAYLTGEAEIPKEKDMLKANQKQLEAEMQIPWLRITIDRNYAAEFNDLPDNHWVENAEDERIAVLDKQMLDFFAKRLARDIKSAKYPLDLGDWKKLNSKGQTFVDILQASGNLRAHLKTSSKDNDKMTFRDVENESLVSLYTGTHSCALPNPWLDLVVPKGEETTLETIG